MISNIKGCRPRDHKDFNIQQFVEDACREVQQLYKELDIDSFKNKSPLFGQISEEIVGNILIPSQKRNTPTKCRPNLKTSNLMKPQLLIHIEAYIDRELSLLCETISPTSTSDEPEIRQLKVDARLQVFREVVNVLLKKLITFRPILSQVKEAYELAISVRDARIENIDKIKIASLNLETNTEEKIALVKRRGEEKISEITKEKIKVLEKFDELCSERKTDKTVIKKLQEELTLTHERLLKEIDSKRLLLLDMRQMQQQMDSLRNKIPVAKEKSEQDSVLLRVALDKCRADYIKALTEINEYKTAYADTIPIHHFEALEETVNLKQTEITSLKDELTSLKKEFVLIQGKYQATTIECAKLSGQVAAMHRSATPRPIWKKCGEYVRGGKDKWSMLTQDKTSKEKLVILLEELCGNEGNEDNYFYGQGTGSNVPIYLQFQGKVKNRRLGRRDVIIIINDILNERELSDLSQPLGEFIAEYFMDRYHLPLLRAEWAYNLVAACEGFLHDERISLFWGILSGQIQEDVYHGQRRDLKMLYETLKRKMNLHDIDTIPTSAFADITSSVFPLKNELQINDLVEATLKQLKIDSGINDINVDQLFQDTEEGVDAGELAKELRKQFYDERKSFIEDIISELGIDEHSELLVTIDKLKKAIMAKDPNANEKQLDVNLKWIYATDNFRNALPIPAQQIRGRLEGCNLRRAGTK